MATSRDDGARKPYRTTMSITVRDEAGAVIETRDRVAWHEPDGTEITDRSRIAELEAALGTGDFADGQMVEVLANNDETWIGGCRVSRMLAPSLYFVVVDGVEMGAPAERIRPASGED